MTKESFEGKRIRELREALGWQQGVLTDKTGIKQASISRIESGKQHPGLRTLKRIAAALGVELSVLSDESSPAQAMQPQPGGRPQAEKRAVEGREMRLTRLCVALNLLLKAEETNIEIALVHTMKSAIPDFFDAWPTGALTQIQAIRDILTAELGKLRRRRGHETSA